MEEKDSLCYNRCGFEILVQNKVRDNVSLMSGDLKKAFPLVREVNSFKEIFKEIQTTRKR